MSRPSTTQPWESTSKLSPYQYSHLLVTGYIREIQSSVITTQIIPGDIHHLVWEFYHFAKLLFCLSVDQVISATPRVYIAYSGDLTAETPENTETDLNPQQSVASDESNVSNHVAESLEKSSSFYQHPISEEIGSLFLSGNCSTTQCHYFPAALPDSFRPDATTVLFKCGGWSKGFNHALIIDTNSLSEEDCVYNWRLPPFKSVGDPYGNCIAFSIRNQCLYSAGGQYSNSDKLRALYLSQAQNLNESDEDWNDIEGHWEWNELSPMEHHRYNPVGVVLEQSQRLMVVGGKDEKQANYPNLKSVSMYHIANEEWMDVSDCNVPRRAGGICCSAQREEVFIGGGIDDEDNGYAVECYDGGKDKWTRLSNTNHPHRLHPVMWVENGWRLYIGSILQDKEHNGCEMMDLRAGDGWVNVVESDLLGRAFGITSDVQTDNLYLVTN